MALIVSRAVSGAPLVGSAAQLRPGAVLDLPLGLVRRSSQDIFVVGVGQTVESLSRASERMMG